MTKKLLLTFTLLLTAVTGAFADDSGSWGDVSYSYVESTNTLTISGTGTMADYASSSDQPWKDYRSSIKTVVIGAGVTTIGGYAFEGCSGLTTVSFAEGSQLETIGGNAFNSCSDLTSITIPASVTSISADAFVWCSKLETMTVEDGNEVYDSRNNCNAIIEKSTNTLIVGCNNSTIPVGVTTIGEGAFSVCRGLKSITIPASVTTIGEDAFDGCLDLATVTVYAPSCTLGIDAFENCPDLTIYVFSDLVDYYQNADNWKNYADKITEIPNPNGNCGENVRWVLTGESTNYTLTITGTGAMADYEDPSKQPWIEYRSSIKTVVITSGVTSIGDHAFESCTGLASITLAEGLTTIGGYAFYNCGTTIESVTIPESVTSIGENAFNGTNVTNFYINNIPSKIAIGETPFKADGVTIHVFTQMQSTFENATNWSAYTGHFNADIAISHVQSITLDNESMIMKTNTSGKLNATINPADARVKDVVFTSSNDNIIHITNAATGEFEAGSKEGNATITCTAMDGSGKYASCTVTVNKLLVPAQSVTLNMKKMSIEVGNTNNQLFATINPTDATYKYVTWRSSDENVATVDNTGNVTAIVTAIAPGVATITAISHDGQARANCEVTVVASGSCGTDVTWTLTGTSPNYTLTISGTGAIQDAVGGSMPWNSYKSSITTLIIEDGVTSIGEQAFDGCSSLNSVTIPASVTTIDRGAFCGCNSLTSIEIPSGVTSIGNFAFDGCTDLTSIEIPASVTSIDGGAFKGCISLTSIEIPASVTSIGGGAFEDCTGLNSVTICAPQLGEHNEYSEAFVGNASDRKIYVFENCMDYYKAQAWSVDYPGMGFYKEDILPITDISLKDNDDNSTLIAAANDNALGALDVTLKGRTLYKDGDWNTLCLPFSVTVGSGVMADATAMTLNTSTSGFNSETGVLTLNFDATSGTILAGTPFIVKWTGTDVENPVFSGVTIDNSDAAIARKTQTSTDGTVSFKGTYASITYTEENKSILFVGGENSLYWPTAGSSIGAQRAYFELNDGEMARNIVLNFFDEQSGKAERDGENATGIHSTTNFTRSSLLASLAKNCTNLAGAYYTLDGRMLAGKPSAPGIYVKDGRKVAIKSAK